MRQIEPGSGDAGIEHLHTWTVSDHEHRNVQLRTLVLDIAARIPDRGTNKAGNEPSYFVNKWLSDRKLHLNPHPEIRSLVELIVDRANRLPWPGVADPVPLRIASMWAIVSCNGMEGVAHTHTGRVSGVYYVDTGNCDGDRNGALAVHFPDGRLRRLIPPQPGLLLLFPHDMWHSVLRYEGEQPRIVIAFNLS